MTLPMNRREMLMTLGATAGALASFRLVRAQEGQPHPLGRPRTYEWKKPGRPVTAAIMGAGNRCDNDVVDNQVVNIEFGDISAAFSMEGLTSYAGRRTRVMGTRGDIVGDENQLDVFDFQEKKRYLWTVRDHGQVDSGHGGGDFGLVRDWVQAISRHDENLLTTTLEASMESHLIGFTAEASRLEGGVMKPIDRRALGIRTE